MAKDRKESTESNGDAQLWRIAHWWKAEFGSPRAEGRDAETKEAVLVVLDSEGSPWLIRLWLAAKLRERRRNGAPVY
ncbi:hypothetical protein CCMA1212_002919 [Trichoderma ghanense]|uniref:Uncharacterized protein n=1 Tax=Trichoderma ghanense TaxID=65468 RepID=A0ABY2HC19_9HYPO